MKNLKCRRCLEAAQLLTTPVKTTRIALDDEHENTRADMPRGSLELLQLPARCVRNTAWETLAKTETHPRNVKSIGDNQHLFAFGRGESASLCP